MTEKKLSQRARKLSVTQPRIIRKKIQSAARIIEERQANLKNICVVFFFFTVLKRVTGNSEKVREEKGKN